MPGSSIKSRQNEGEKQQEKKQPIKLPGMLSRTVIKRKKISGLKSESSLERFNFIWFGKYSCQIIFSCKTASIRV
jgi:hypothetical protein